MPKRVPYRPTEDQTGHQPWCLPAQHHTDGPHERCVSLALETTGDVACWLVADDEGARVVLTATPDGAELATGSARTLAEALLALDGLARA